MEAVNSLQKAITIKEIENVILNANVDKAPGVDGLKVGFYRACWHIIKEDVVNAIMDFFFAQVNC